MIKVRGLDHFVLRVRDLERSLGFYRDVLDMPVLFLEEYQKGTRPFVSVRAGASLIDLVPDPTYDPQAGFAAGGFLHCCVEIDNQLEEVIPWLKERGVEVLEDQPMRRIGARGLGLAIYTRDPDGYIVELKQSA